MFDPDKVYDPAQGPSPGGPKPKVPPGTFDPDKIKIPSGSTAPILGGGEIPDAQKDFRFALKTDANNQKLRAQDQGTLESIGLTLGNLIPNIVTGVGEMVGQFGALATEFGDDRDYSNALTRQMEDWHNPLGEVYRENPDKVWDMGDSAWWTNNLGQLAESAVTFAIPGGVEAKVFERLAAGAAEVLKAGQVGTKLLKGAAQLSTAALLGYQEGAQSGYMIYDKAYKTQFQKNIDAGIDPDRADQMAKKVASDAASSTVRMYTGLGAILNLTALTPLFKRVDDEAYAWLSTAGKREAGETMGAWKQRIVDAGFDNKDIAKIFAPRHGISGLASETFQEGSEEFIQNYFDKKGEEKGNGTANDGISFFEDFLNKTMDQEGALNFALGALGGGAQTLILDNIPLHRVQKYDAANQPIFKTNDGQVVYDAKGSPKYETKLVSSRTRNQDKAKVYFENVKDAIIKDIDWFNNKNTEMMNTKDPVLKESLRNQIFSVNNLNAVTQGIGDSWIKQYQEIHDIDNSTSLGEKMQPQIDQLAEQVNQAAGRGDTAKADELNKQRQALILQQGSLMNTTEAMQKGYAKDTNDDWYKEQAQGAITDLKELQKMWDDTRKKYNQSEEQKAAGLADYIFAHQADLYQNQKVLKHAEADYAKLVSEYDIKHIGITDDFDYVAQGYLSDFKAGEQERDAYEEDHKDAKVKEKYHNLNPGTLRALLIGKINRINKQLEELNLGLQQSFDTTDWKINNPKGTYEDYYKALNTQINDRADLHQYKAQIEEHRTRTQGLNDKLNEITSQKGVLKTVKTTQLQKKNYVAEIEARNKKENTEAKLAQRSDKAAREANKVQLSARERNIREQMLVIENRMGHTREAIDDLQAQIRNLKYNTSLWKQFTKDTNLADLKDQVKTKQTDQAHDQFRLDQLKNELSAVLDAKIESEETGDVVEPPKAEDPAPAPPVIPVTVAPTTSDDAGIVYKHTPEEDAYHKALESLSPEARNVVTDYEMTLKRNPDRELLYSDVLKNPIIKNMPSSVKQDIAAALVALKSYLESISIYDGEDIVQGDAGTEEDTDMSPAPNIEYEEPVDDFEEPDPIITQPEYEPVMPTDSPETYDVLLEVAHRVHKGKMATSGVTLINSTLDYIDYQDNDGNYRMVSMSGKLNPNTNQDVLTPGKLTGGTVVTIRMSEYNGPSNSNNAPNSFRNIPYADFFDKDGNILKTDHAIGNVPIGIFDEDSALLGYLPTQSRIKAQFYDADNFRNIPQELVESEAAKNMELRRLITTATGEMSITIADKGPGTLIENYEKINDKSYRRTKLPALRMIPDTSLQMGIMAAGAVNTEKNSPTTLSINNAPEDLATINRAPVVILPMANGTHTVSPLSMNTFTDTDGSINTIMQAIKVFVTGIGRGEATALNKVIGFDINTPVGLRGFINQYFTFTESFDTKQTLMDPALAPPGTRQRFLFNVSDTGVISVGTSMNGTKPLIANMTNLEQFKLALSEGLKTRYRNIVYSDDSLGLSGINSSNQFTEPIWAGNVWKYKEHANYNAYVKANSTTFINGTNRLNNGKYTYAANPQITLDEKSLVMAKTYTATNLEVISPSTTLSMSHMNGQDVADAGLRKFASWMSNHPILNAEEAYNLLAEIINHMKQNNDPQYAIDEKQAILDEVNVYKDGKHTFPTSITITAEDEDLAESLGFGYYQSPNAPVATIIQPSSNLTPISLAVLKDLYTFTSPGERNGMTPEQVLDDMIQNGIPYIAEGHNPFTKCN